MYVGVKEISRNTDAGRADDDDDDDETRTKEKRNSDTTDHYQSAPDFSGHLRSL